MIQHQKRSIAYVLAVLSIVLSLFLWAGIVRSFMAPLAQVTGEDTPAAPEPVSSSGGSLPSGDTGMHAVTPMRSAPLMPPLHFAGSATPVSTDRGSTSSSVADQQKSDELAQWEIRELATLSIPSLSIRSTVFLPSRRYWDAHDWETMERQMQVGLLYGVVSYPHAVLPGANGTIVIAGHSSPPNDRARESRFGTIFASLPAIEPTVQIILRTGSETVTYAVVDTRIVPAGDTTILVEQKEESLLKLITCYPIGSTKDRFVVIAKRVEE
jgi:LPXTG-site transpeptidase (sortase) family protein